MDTQVGGMIVALILLVFAIAFIYSQYIEERFDAIEHIEQQTGHTQ